MLQAYTESQPRDHQYLIVHSLISSIKSACRSLRCSLRFSFSQIPYNWRTLKHRVWIYLCFYLFLPPYPTVQGSVVRNYSWQGSGTICGTWNQTWVSWMQVKFSIRCPFSLVPSSSHFKFWGHFGEKCHALKVIIKKSSSKKVLFSWFLGPELDSDFGL